MEYGLWNFHSGFWQSSNGAVPPEGITRGFYNSVNNGVPTGFHTTAPNVIEGGADFAAACRQNFRAQSDFAVVKPSHGEERIQHLVPMNSDMMAEQSSMESVSSTVGGDNMLDAHNSNLSSSHDSSPIDSRKVRQRVKRSPQWEAQDGKQPVNNGMPPENPTVDYLSQQSYQHPMYGMIVRGMSGTKQETAGSDDTEDEDDVARELAAAGGQQLQQPRELNPPSPSRSPPVDGSTGGDSPTCSNTLAGQRTGYECGECDLVADTRPGLKKHIAVCHPGPNAGSDVTSALLRKMSSTIVCPMGSCRFRTTERHELETHVARHVAEGYSPNGKKRAGPVSLQRVRYEREEYRCQMCAYSCTIEKAFYKHLKVHSLGLQLNQVKISCVICGKDRSSEVDMNKHMRKHRDDRYFCCDICIFKTVQLKKLIQHRRMHTGEKPHLCPHCSYRSARRDNLRSHVRRVHKKDNLFCDTFSPRGLLLSASVTSPSPSPSQPGDAHE